MWVELPEGVDVAELEQAARERDVLFVKGTRLPARGGREHAAARLLGGDARADRRGGHAARRRGAVAGRDRVTQAIGSTAAVVPPHARGAVA